MKKTLSIFIVFLLWASFAYSDGTPIDAKPATAPIAGEDSIPTRRAATGDAASRTIDDVKDFVQNHLSVATVTRTDNVEHADVVTTSTNTYQYTFGEDAAFYYPDSAESDQGITATGDGDTMYDIVQALGANDGVIRLQKGALSGETVFTLTTSLTIPANIALIVDPGVVIDGAGILTANGHIQVWDGYDGTASFSLTSVPNDNFYTLRVPITLTADLDLSAYTGHFYAGATIDVDSYTFTAPPDFNGIAGCFDVSGGGSVTGLKHADPAWWGIDGASDETEINYALAAANKVELLGSAYSIDGPIVAASDKEIYGLGIDKTIITLAVNDSKMLTFTGVDNFYIHDLTLNGGSDSLTTSGTYLNEQLVYLYSGCNDIIFERVHITKALSDSFHSQGTVGDYNNRIKFIDSKITNGSRQAMNFWYYTKNVRVERCYFENATSTYGAVDAFKSGVDFNGVEDGIVRDCRFIQTNDTGGSGVIFEQDSGGNPSIHCHAINNYAEGQKYNTFKNEDSDYCTWVGNYGKNAGTWGLAIAGSNHCKLVGNTLEGSGDAGIRLYQSGDTSDNNTNIELIGNDVIDCNSNENTDSDRGAYYISSTYGLILSGGYVVDNNARMGGILIGSSTNYLIDGVNFVGLYHDAITGFQWTASGSGTNEYYLEASGGGDPGFLMTPETVFENGVFLAEGTAGSLAVSTWDYGDNDTLGYNTIYIRLSDGSDPDSKAANYVQYEFTIFDNHNETSDPGREIINCKGFKTREWGEATISNGNTSVNVIPNSVRELHDSGVLLQITPKESLGTASFFYGIDISESYFSINVNADPGQDVDFYWLVDVSRSFDGKY